MITVHHLEHSRSHRVLWLLEELGLDYAIVRYPRDPATLLAPPELKRIHPLGKSPVVVDGQDVLAESGAILETLVERYDSERRLAPTPGTSDALRYRYWLHYAEGSLMPPLLVALVASRIRTAPVPFFVRPVARGIADKVQSGFAAPQLTLHLDYLENELAQRPWFAGQGFSAADIQMSYPLVAASGRGGLGGRPRLQAFLERIQARPAYQRALDKGGPVELPAASG